MGTSGGKVGTSGGGVSTSEEQTGTRGGGVITCGGSGVRMDRMKRWSPRRDSGRGRRLKEHDA